MREDNIVVRRCTDKDCTDIIKAGYPFYSSTLSLSSSLKNINRKEIKRILLRNLLPLNKEGINLAAYSKKDRKAVGVVTLRKVTDSLWVMSSIFVSPSSRGKRIASLLYQESFKLLKERKIKKVAGTVFLDNVASVKSVQRNWQGFLPARIFECKKGKQMDESKLPKEILIRKIHDEKGDLFETFRNCVGEQWCRVLEMDKTNFLDRLSGPAYFEPIRKNFLTRLILKVDVLVAEYKGKTEGYAISRTDRFFQAFHYLHLFVPVSDNFEDVSKGLLIKALNPSTYTVCVGDVEIENRLRKLGFQVRQAVVAYKHL